VKVLDHPAHSSVFVSKNFHSFLHLKKYLVSQMFHKDEEVKNEVTTWLRAKGAEFCDIRTQKLVSRPNKCLDRGGD